MSHTPDLRSLYIGLIQSAPDRLATPLSAANAWIKGINSEIAELSTVENTDCRQDKIDDACDELEDAIGVCFLICQPSITRIITMAQMLVENEAQGKKSKRFYLALGEKMSLDAPFSKVAVMDAFANYYKHRDEWGMEPRANGKSQPRCWCSLRSLIWPFVKGEPVGKNRGLKTLKVVSKAGVKDGDSDNLRKGARALGNLSYSDTRVFKEIIQDWSRRVIEDIKKTEPKRK